MNKDKLNLIFSGNEKLNNNPETLSCKLTTVELQKRKAPAIARLKQQIIDRKELKDGFAFKFRGTDESIDELIKFIKAERECCDFFTFNISINKSDVWLELTGAEEVKEFIKNEIA
jgi:hypothetical protein